MTIPFDENRSASLRGVVSLPVIVVEHHHHSRQQMSHTATGQSCASVGVVPDTVATESRVQLKSRKTATTAPPVARRPKVPSTGTPIDGLAHGL
jgi:hypothetical protein